MRKKCIEVLYLFNHWLAEMTDGILIFKFLTKQLIRNNNKRGAMF